MQIRYIDFKIYIWLDHINSNTMINKTMKSSKSYDKVAKIKKKERQRNKILSKIINITEIYRKVQWKWAVLYAHKVCPK